MIQNVITVILVLIATAVVIGSLAPDSIQRWILRRLGRFAPRRLQRSIETAGCGACAARHDGRPPPASR